MRQVGFAQQIAAGHVVVLLGAGQGGAVAEHLQSHSAGGEGAVVGHQPVGVDSHAVADAAGFAAALAEEQGDRPGRLAGLDPHRRVQAAAGQGEPHTLALAQAFAFRQRR